MFTSVQIAVLTLAFFQVGNGTPLFGLNGLGIGNKGHQPLQPLQPLNSQNKGCNGLDEDALTLTLALPIGKQGNSCGCGKTQQIIPQPQIIPQIIPQPQIIAQPQYVQQQPQFISSCQQQVILQPIVYEQPQIIQQSSCGCGSGGFF